MADTTVSVVIPCFNHGEFLPEAVASVTGLRRDDVELIVVDDGSTDERTRQEMQALSEQGITVLRQANQGLAAARNAGIRVSRGQYILPLDADNRVRPGYFDHGIRILAARAAVGVVYGDAQHIGIRNDRWKLGAFQKYTLLRRNFIDACAMYRRQIWEQNGGYDGGMPVQGMEDWDLWLGALEHGWQFAYVPEVLFDYRIHKESMRTHYAGLETELYNFVATKHPTLYRDGYARVFDRYDHLEGEKASVRATWRNLQRLLKLRLVQRLSPNGKR